MRKNYTAVVKKGLDHITTDALAAARQATHQRRYEIEEALAWIEAQRERVTKRTADQAKYDPYHMEGG